jgi:hypothetical protein
MGKHLICPPELSRNPTSSHLAAKQKELTKKMNPSLRSIVVHTSKGSITCRLILRHGADGCSSLPNEVVLRIVIALGRVEPVNLGSNGKHANHYTTEDDFKDLRLLNNAGSLKALSKIIAKQAFVPEVVSCSPFNS